MANRTNGRSTRFNAFWTPAASRYCPADLLIVVLHFSITKSIIHPSEIPAKNSSWEMLPQGYRPKKRHRAVLLSRQFWLPTPRWERRFDLAKIILGEIHAS